MKKSGAKILLISGPPAAGKTSFTNFLSQKLNLPSITKDGIKEVLFDTLGWQDEALVKEFSKVSFELLYFLLEKQLYSKKSVIIEGNFIPEVAIDRIKPMLADNSGSILEFYFYAHSDLLRERFKRRITENQRHPGHIRKSLAEINFNAKPLAIERVIDVDTSDFNTVNYDNLLLIASEFINQQ